MGVRDETVRVWLLGGFRISVGSRMVWEKGWRLRKAAGLIKLLALAPGHRMHREQLMDLLWQELDEKAQANNLRGALHVARRTLDPASATASGYLRLQSQELVLCSEEPLWVDVEAFEAAAGTAEGSRDAALYRAAIALYSGDLLPEDRYEVWAEERREVSRQTFLGLLLKVAELDEEREDFGSAVAMLGQVVSVEPTHEGARVGLMRLYARSGKHHEATLEYERLRRVLAERFGTEPGETARRLYDEILAGKARRRPARREPSAAPVPEGLHNLPAERTSFVGREQEVVEVERLLAMTRLLTLTGTGGSGKTRFALKVAGDVVGTYPDGAWLVELAPLSDPELVPQAVAEAIGALEQPGRSLAQTLVDALKTKKVLLVLDNCEHLVEAAARLTEALLDSCPGLKVLATSREALNVAGELTWLVPPLAMPDPGHQTTADGLAGYESVRLFLERGRYRQPDFALTPANARSVADVCRRLDGIPLAIELAAARLGSLSVEQISERLEHSSKLLVGLRTAPQRQRTLEGALDWSYELLSEPEKRLFGRMSVFSGGWTLDAAEAVGAGEGIEEDEVLDLLSRLVEKSLIVAQTNGGAEVRYRLLEPVRHYGLQRLEESGDGGSVRHRHAAFFLALGEEAQPELAGARQQTWLVRLESEHDNLRSALAWATKVGDARLVLRLGEALSRFWHMRGHLSEGRRWLERGLAEGSAVPASVRAKALSRVGWMAGQQGDGPGAVARLDESLTLFRVLGDRESIAMSLADLGWAVVQHQTGKEHLTALCEEAEKLRNQPLDPRTKTHLLDFLGLAAVDGDNLELAETRFEESLALHRELENARGIAMCLAILGTIALVRSDDGRAAAFFEESMRLVRVPGDKVGVAYDLLGLAAVAGLQARPVRAARLWGAEEAIREGIDLVSMSSLLQARYDYEGRVADVRSRLTGEEFAAAWSEGRAMTLEQAAEYSLSREEPRTADPVRAGTPGEATWTALTSREREVALLAARELTNREIAEELTVSEHTVATHVRRILKKLGLRSRTQIAAWAIEQELLS